MKSDQIPANDLLFQLFGLAKTVIVSICSHADLFQVLLILASPITFFFVPVLQEGVW